MRKLLLSLAVLLIAGTALGAGSLKIWNTAEEALPADSESLALANERMQDIKVNTRGRLEVEHWVGDFDNGDDNGVHRHGSARCFAQDAEPTALADSEGTLDSTGGTAQHVTDLNDSASNSAAALTDDVGHGRCWVDIDGADGVTAADCTGSGTDDGSGSPATGGTSACCTGAGTGPTCEDDNYMLHVYEGVAGDNNGAWADAKVTEAILADTATVLTGTSGGAINTDDEILAGSPNLVYNGSFEATDGTGLAASTTVPAGWAVITTPTIGYTDPSGDDSYGEGYQVDVTNAGTTDEGISYELDALPEDAVYKVIARAIDDGTAVCTLDVSGNGGAAFTPVATATDAWETLSGTFGTDTAAKDDNVLITLVTTGADTQVCSWDHVRVYQINDITADREEVSTWGGVILVTSAATLETGMTDTTPTDDTSMAVTLNPPSQNCVIEVDALIGFEAQAGVSDSNIGVTCQLDENGTNKTVQSFGGEIDGAAWNTGAGVSYAAFNIALHYDVANPTPGTPLAYTIECADKLHSAAAAADEVDYDCTDQSCFLNAKMFCGGN